MTKSPSFPEESYAQFLQTPVLESTFTVFDLETTGGNPSHNGITEVFALRFHKGVVVDTFYSLVNPQTPIPPMIRRMTGITPAMVKDAPVISAILPQLLAFLEGSVLVSHNTQGDLTFLRYFAERDAQVQLKNFYLCTHLLGEKLWPASPRKNLSGLADFLGIALDTVHRAQADTYITLELFKKILEKFPENRIATMEEAIRFQGDYESLSRIGWAIPKSQLEDLPATPGLFRLYDRDHRLIFGSSAAQVKREVARLRNPIYTPKKLIKLVIQSHDIEVESTPNLFSGMIAESRLPQSRFLAINWHMRHLVFFSIREEGSRAILSLGHDLEGAVDIIGPVYDRRRAQGLLEQIAEKTEALCQRKEYSLPLSLWLPVRAVLTQSVEETSKALRKARNRFQVFFQKNRRAELSTQLHVLKELGALSVGEKYTSLLKVSGVISCKCFWGDSWLIYPIYELRLGEPTSIEGDWQVWLDDTVEGQAYWEQIKHPSLASREKSEKNPLLQAMILWAMMSGKEATKHRIESRIFLAEEKDGI